MLINTRSIIPKLDELKLWVESSKLDVLFITETWLKKSIGDSLISMAGYNIDHPKVGELLFL